MPSIHFSKKKSEKVKKINDDKKRKKRKKPQGRGGGGEGGGMYGCMDVLPKPNFFMNFKTRYFSMKTILKKIFSQREPMPKFLKMFEF